MTASASRGKLLQDIFLDNLRALQRGFTAAYRERPIIWNVSSTGTFVGGLTPGIVLAEAGRILRDSRKVYRWENSLVYEFGEQDNHRLRPLCVDGEPVAHAASTLA